MKNLHLSNRSAWGMMAATLTGVATSASAQEAAPAPQQTSLEAPQNTVSKDEREPLLTLNFKDVDVRNLLGLIDDTCPQKILIGEAVVGKIRFISIKNKPLTAALDVVCRTSNLTWGYLDRDTIVVIPALPGLTRPVPDLSQLPFPRGPFQVSAAWNAALHTAARPQNSSARRDAEPRIQESQLRIGAPQRYPRERAAARVQRPDILRCPAPARCRRAGAATV